MTDPWTLYAKERQEAHLAREKAVLLGDAVATAARCLDKDDPKTRPVRLALIQALKQAGYTKLPPT